MILFLDTEFTGLGQRKPKLISIGLVDEDGERTFYAELPSDCYLDNCTIFAKADVLPRLEGGECVIQLDDLRQRLRVWIEALGGVQIAYVSWSFAFPFLKVLLDPWPTNVNPIPLFLQIDADREERFTLAMEQAFAGGLRRHHALDDAKANRLGWIAAGGNMERVAP